METIAVDLSRYLSLQIAALKLCCIWIFIPYSVKTIRFWISILIRIFLGITVFIIPVCGQLIYVIKLFKLGNVEIQEVAGIINLIMTELLASIRLLDLFLRRDILIQLEDQLMSKEFQFYSQPQKSMLEKAVSNFRKLFWVLIISCFSDVMVHMVVVPGIRKFKVLPVKMDLIWFDDNKESHFDYIFAYQVLYKPIVVTIFVALQTLPWAAMSCTISQLDVLIYNFENMKELVKVTMAERQCDSITAFKEIFKGCVLHHRSIIRFVNTLQNAFGGQLSSTIGLSGAIICTTAVQIFSIQSPLKNITDVAWTLVYLSILIANLFIDCYFGNSITVRSQHISTVVFSCPWIDQPTSFKKNLVLFIAKTQQPIVIVAAKIVPVSLETFTKIMNWTYKGFAVMNQMKK